MGTIIIDNSELKELVRKNLIEILKDRNDILQIMEDVVFGKMIEKGKTGKYVNKEKIIDLIDKI